MDEVWSELAAEGVAGGRTLRNRLAQKLIAFACQGRADSQAKELLLRTFRNETLAALHAGHVPRSRGLRLKPPSPINERLPG